MFMHAVLSMLSKFLFCVMNALFRPNIYRKSGLCSLCESFFSSYLFLEKSCVSHLFVYNLQVREKLTDAEYKEFLGFLTALKSKAMKIGHALQSIARLFSVPDRLSLLHGYQIF